MRPCAPRSLSQTTRSGPSVPLKVATLRPDSRLRHPSARSEAGRLLLRRKCTAREIDLRAEAWRRAGEGPDEEAEAEGSRVPPASVRQENGMAKHCRYPSRELPLFLGRKKPYFHSFEPRRRVFLFLQTGHAENQGKGAGRKPDFEALVHSPNLAEA